MHTVDVVQLGHRLRAGLTGDADQRAATDLLIKAGHGVWLVKLSGWPQYLQDFDGRRVPDGLWIDWAALRADLVADERAAGEFRAWPQSSAGRQASEDEVDATYTQMVPRRPWHGASGSELVLLRIALELAPGGLLGDGLPRLADANTSAVLTAAAELAEGAPAQFGARGTLGSGGCLPGAPIWVALGLLGPGSARSGGVSCTSC